MAERIPKPDLPVAEAIGRMLEAIEPVGDTEALPLHDAHGRVLAADLVSPIDVPPCDNAAMDGYALRAAELDPSGPAELPVVGLALAGHPYAGTCPPGACVRIMTGAPMPAGLDTVVPQELVARNGDRVRVPAGLRPGQNRRRAGEDLAAGGLALPGGRRLGPADIGLAASLGIERLVVRRRPRIAWISTGDELQAIGRPLSPGRIYDSNRYTVGALLDRLGVESIDLGVVADRPDALEVVLRDAAGRADAIVTSGGVSVGEADHTRAVLSRLGHVEFWSIAMRPGRPMAFGRIGPAWYFGLPGNPVAAMIAFSFLARPALLALAGAAPTPPVPLRARATAPIDKRAGRTEYPRGIVGLSSEGTPCVAPDASQGSGVLSSMSRANCVIVLAHERGPVRAGEWVDCVPFEGLW
jgi:molybdopterin molybdotransferase